MLSGDIHPGSLRHHEMCSVKNVSFLPWCYVPLLSGTGSVSCNEQEKKKKKIYNTKKQSNSETLKFHKLQAQKIVIYDIAVY